jgi:hypothetical protein
MKQKAITAEQQIALDEFIALNGSRWKSKLSAAWMSGADVNALRVSDGCYLRQLRNSHGPKWLASFKA